MVSISPFPAKMYRSATSTSRASDEFLVNLLPEAATAAVNSSPAKASAYHHHDDLPIYNLISDATKKELALHHKSQGENAIHLIPLLLIFCGFILWLFSLPETTKLRYNNINNINNLNDTSIFFNRTRFCTLADLR
ncbi:hypothetical protein LWI29_012914 [Acer saccharum]|uniref:Uncharacterized protein n=1 Tax=Acer saccharum TaxID=4024 RepID=A0AA39RDF3_ACESA|nr:hypothetical protein LWI29_012914 [Acer saccharum]